MEIREIKVKSILGKSSICDYCINPYVGCEHACIYCYADYYTKKFSKHKEEWGSFVDIKINADSILKKEIKKIKPSSVWISSLTDPYQPLELKYEITKKCIEILLKNDFFIIIQTKSSNVIRDLEIFKKYKNNVEIVFTITMLEENFRKIFEPFASSIKSRLDAAKNLIENSISVSSFFGPILPYISDLDLENYFKTMKEIGIKKVFIDKLRLKPGIWERLEKGLKNYPEILEKWKKIFFEKSDYYFKLKREIKEIGEKFGIELIFCY